MFFLILEREGTQLHKETEGDKVWGLALTQTERWREGEREGKRRREGGRDREENQQTVIHCPNRL